MTSQQPCWWCVRGQKKSISLLWELNPIFCKLFEKKFYRIDHQHTTNMAAFSRGCKPRIWVLSKSFINPFVRDEWIWLGKNGLSRSWLPEAEAHKKGLVRIMPSKLSEEGGLVVGKQCLASLLILSVGLWNLLYLYFVNLVYTSQQNMSNPSASSIPILDRVNVFIKLFIKLICCTILIL